MCIADIFGWLGADGLLIIVMSTTMIKMLRSGFTVMTCSDFHVNTRHNVPDTSFFSSFLVLQEFRQLYEAGGVPNSKVSGMHFAILPLLSSARTHVQVN